jgi:hypothetical protein
MLAEATEMQELARAIVDGIRATDPGTNWGLIAILCTVIVALAGALSHQIAARFKRQSDKHEELRRIFYETTGAHRERMARIEGHSADIDAKYVHNVPEIFARIGALEKGCAACGGTKGGK